MVNSISPNSGMGSNNVTGSTHTVKSGDTLSAIAKQNGVSVNDIMKANPQISNANMIHPGQEIRLPGGGGKTGSLGGMKVSQSSTPAERPTMGAQDGIAAQKASLPSPYSKYTNEIMA